MKPVYIFLIALATGLVGAGFGLFLGGKFGGILGLADGSLYGICVATETAKDEGILTEVQTTQLLDQIKARAGSDFKLEPKVIEEFAKINCSEMMQEMQQSNQE